MVLGLLKRSSLDIELQSYKDKQSASNFLAMQGEDIIASGNLKDAVRCFEKAIELNPANEHAWGGKALALDRLKRYSEALECYEKAIECNPSNAITWHNRGLTLASLKMLQESVHSFEKALEINPKYGKAWYNKGRLLAKLGDNGSQHCLDMARKLDPLLFMKLRGR